MFIVADLASLNTNLDICDSQKVGRELNRGYRIHVYSRTTFNIIKENKHSIYSRVDKGTSCSTQVLWFESQVDVIFS